MDYHGRDFALYGGESRPFAFMRLSPTDALIVMGLALVGIGTWLLSPPAALIIVGAILLVIGLTAAMRGR